VDKPKAQKKVVEKKQKKANPSDENYDKLKCKLNVLDQKSTEYEMINQYV
jgi:hypothetical protein